MRYLPATAAPGTVYGTGARRPRAKPRASPRSARRSLHGDVVGGQPVRVQAGWAHCVCSGPGGPAAGPAWIASFGEFVGLVLSSNDRGVEVVALLRSTGEAGSTATTTRLPRPGMPGWSRRTRASCRVRPQLEEVIGHGDNVVVAVEPQCPGMTCARGRSTTTIRNAFSMCPSRW